MSISRRHLGIAIVRQYERGVVFRLGRVRDVRDPGVRFMIPLVDRMPKVTPWPWSTTCHTTWPR
ncbi:SPFH domain-containing protein [Microbispora sp. H11081]|uniref:SPFH domain-containing protein n=1 Tax=Microbispora sp. H11081 TaxID=2729107 RepID=UPI001472D409|nr:SPFH domain-containing protein [Microbispora sp. H11081]